MSGIATAIAGSAIVGGVVANNASNRAVDAQEAAGEKASQQLAAATGQARGDLFKLFPSSQQNMQQGYQGALDVFKQSLPQQAGAMQAGNVAAQNQLLTGMPQFQNAILGAPVDYSQFQATQLQQPNFDFSNQQLQYNDPYAAPAQQQQGQFSSNSQIGPYPAGNDSRYLSGQPINNNQPTDRAFNYNDLLTRGFR
jgi:hypothetical protein